MHLHAYNVENIVIQYALDVKVGYSDIAGKPEDKETRIQCRPKISNMVIDGKSNTCPHSLGNEVVDRY